MCLCMLKFPLENYYKSLENLLQESEYLTLILTNAYVADKDAKKTSYVGFDGDDCSWREEDSPNPNWAYRLVVPVPILIERHYRLAVEDDRCVDEVLEIDALRQQFREQIRIGYAKLYGPDDATS